MYVQGRADRRDRIVTWGAAKAGEPPVAGEVTKRRISARLPRATIGPRWDLGGELGRGMRLGPAWYSPLTMTPGSTAMIVSRIVGGALEVGR